jgi:hypothetical protein
MSGAAHGDNQHLTLHKSTLHYLPNPVTFSNTTRLPFVLGVNKVKLLLQICFSWLEVCSTSLTALKLMYDSSIRAETEHHDLLIW